MAGQSYQPKKFQWIQDNVNGMNLKVKAMIKLIEEDADSFARRAEMYYKKRSELEKLAEEFYRGYRALAERYEQSTRLLYHAHWTIAEALPKQIAVFSDESRGLSAYENLLKSFHQFIHNMIQITSKKKPLDCFLIFYVKKRNAPDYGESDLLSGRKGIIKQYNENFPDGEGPAQAYSSLGKVKKVLNPFEEEIKTIENKAENQDQESKVKQDANNVIKNCSKISPSYHPRYTF